MKSKGYHAAPTNKNKGYATHGGFKNAAQKGGKQGAIKAKPAKEKLSDMSTGDYMKHFVNDVRKQKAKKGIKSLSLDLGQGKY